MKELTINITKAKLISFKVRAKDNKPEVSVTLALQTAGGKTITTYDAQTDAWNDKDKLELPIEAMPLIGDLARVLEAVAVRHCQDGQLALSATAPKNAENDNLPDSPHHESKTAEPVADIDDSPINLDDIDF